MASEDGLETYEDTKAEEELNEKQRVLNEIAKEYTNTLKKNYKISKTWFKRKFVIKIKKKSGEFFEKRADCLYYPTKTKTKIGPTDDCDIFLPSISQSTLVIKQTDDFATVSESVSQVPSKGARIQLPKQSIINQGEIYRIGKIMIQIDSLDPSTLSVSISSLSNPLTATLSENTKIGSSSDSNLRFSDILTPNFQIELKKENNCWKIHNLNPDLIMWKYLSGENSSKTFPVIHSLFNNQFIHVGGNRILLEKIKS
jgi:hypothetical protein